MRRARLAMTVDYFTSFDWKSVLPDGWTIVGIDSIHGGTNPVIMVIETASLDDGPDLDLVIVIQQTIMSRSYLLVERS